jgi:hypothetical protein
LPMKFGGGHGKSRVTGAAQVHPLGLPGLRLKWRRNVQPQSFPPRRRDAARS